MATGLVYYPREKMEKENDHISWTDCKMVFENDGWGKLVLNLGHTFVFHQAWWSVMNVRAPRISPYSTNLAWHIALPPQTRNTLSSHPTCSKSLLCKGDWEQTEQTHDFIGSLVCCEFRNGLMLQKKNGNGWWELTHYYFYCFFIHRLQKMCKIANAASIESALFTVVNVACKYQKDSLRGIWHVM